MSSVLASVLMGLLILPAFAQAPSGKGVNFYSLVNEVELGQQAAASLARTLPIVHEPKLDAYIASLTSKLAGYADPQFVFSVTVYEDRRPVPAQAITMAMPRDAWQGPAREPVALAGGLLFVPLSLLASAQNEAVFAFQLAHAMAHIGLRHSTKLATREGLLNISSANLKAQSASLRVDAANQQTMSLAQLAVTRQFELQADIVATGIVAGAGFDPEAVVRYLERQATPAGGQMSRIFSAHPTSDKRVEAIRAVLITLSARVYTAGSGEFEETKAWAATTR